MKRKGHKMCENMQRYIIERCIRAHFNKMIEIGQISIADCDRILHENLDTWMDNTDCSYCTLSENVGDLYDPVDGPFGQFPLRDDNEDYDTSIDSLNDVLDAYQASMNYPTYYCQMDTCDFVTVDLHEMKQHFIEKHGLEDAQKILGQDEQQTDEEYIILSILMENLNKIKPKPRVYFSIESLEIHKAMKTKLDYDVPPQQPTKLLKELGLLNRKKGEKHRMSCNTFGRRVYNIKIEDLKTAISKSEYENLKIEYNLQSTEDTEDSETRANSNDTQSAQEETRGTDIWDIEF